MIVFEQPMMDLNVLLCTLNDWMAAFSFHSFSNLLDFLDCCNNNGFY